MGIRWMIKNYLSKKILIILVIWSLAFIFWFLTLRFDFSTIKKNILQTSFRSFKFFEQFGR